MKSSLSQNKNIKTILTSEMTTIHQTNSKNNFNGHEKLKTITVNKYKSSENKNIKNNQYSNDIKSFDSKEEINNHMKTFDSEKNIYDNLKYNLKTLKTEAKEKSMFDKNYDNNLSKYSTAWYHNEPKNYKTYYTISNKKNEKFLKDILKKSENFNRYNNDRMIIGIINKFKNKQIREIVHKKFEQFSYKKRIPIKIVFGAGKSNNEIPEIYNNYNFNRRLKQQKIRKLKVSKQLNNLYKKGYHLETDTGLISNKKKPISSSSRKTIFVKDSSINELHQKDPLNNEAYSVFTKHKILKNILPKEVDYNTKTSIEDIINSEIHPLLRYQKKILAQSTNLISQDLNILFGKYLRLCEQQAKNFGVSIEKLELNTNDKYIELIRSLIKKKIITEEKKNTDSKEEEINRIKERKKYLLNKFRDVIILAYKKIKKFNIDINIFYSLMDYNKNDPNFQMELIENGQYLFKAIKAGDIPEIIKFIDKNKYLVAYKDNFNQIPLHICAKRNLYQLIYFLLSRLSSINSQDLGGRTPLMIAAKNNFFEFVTILLFEGADPTLKDVHGHVASQMTTNEKLKIILRRAEILNNLKFFVNSKNFLNYITTGLDFLLKKELEIEYEDWIKEGHKILKDIS